MSSLNDVLAASKEFCAALNQMAGGDATAIASVWAARGSATAQHPIGGRDSCPICHASASRALVIWCRRIDQKTLSPRCKCNA
jgi:hypothetical protein